MLRITDIIFQTVFNILFFLYRIAPYRVDHPFAGRVILAFGKKKKKKKKNFEKYQFKRKKKERN